MIKVTMSTQKLPWDCLFLMFCIIANVFTLSGGCPCRIDDSTKTADCTRSNITFVPDCVPRYIKKLLLSGSDLYAIFQGQFAKFNELTYLDLGYNLIAFLEKEAFTGIPVLHTLILKDNLMFHLQATAFIGLSKLQTLDLSNNCIKVVDENIFSGLLNLKQLYLHSNQIEYLNTSTFAGLQSLERLDVSANQLFYRTSFPLDVFQPVNKLEELVIVSGFLTYGVTVYLDLQLKWLASLKILNISDYPNQNLGLGFTFLKNLQELNMTKSSLSAISNETFKNLKNSPLRTLTLCWSKLSVVYPSTFTFLIHLERLSLTGNYELCAGGLYNVTVGLNFTNISHLQLDYLCQKEWELYASTIEALQGTHLEVLDLSNSNIRAIYKGVYEKLPQSLLTLKLQGNNFLLLDLSHLYFLANLRYLNFGSYLRNKKTLDSYISDEYHNLQKPRNPFCIDTEISSANDQVSNIVFALHRKNLSDTDVSSITQFDGSERTKLRLMDPGQNQYSPEEVQSKWNKVISDLSTSDEYHNLKKQRLSPFSYTKTLHARNQISDTIFPLRHKNVVDPEVSSITQFDVSERRKQGLTHSGRNQFHPEEDECFPLPYMLNTIDLSNGDVVHWILNILCDANNSLKIIDASNNPASRSTEELLKRMKHFRMLEELYLNGNLINEIASDVFKRQTNLKVLSLSRNSLIDVKFEIRTLFSLEILDLSENMIEYIPSHFSQQIETIAKHSNMTVYLHGNRLSCKCDQLDFVTWLLHTRVVFRKDNLTCEYKNGTKLVLSRISDIHTQLKEECLVLPVLLGSIVGIVFLVALCFFAIIYHNKCRLKYFSLIRRDNTNPYHPIEDGKNLLEYDIYLSYDRNHIVNSNKTLQELVTKKIYPSLKQRGLTVIKREELNIGRKPFDVISHALQRSRKVVVFLSNEYCKDQLNVFEFNMALMESIYSNRKVVVPVMLETLNPKDLPDEVDAFLRSGPVAKFTFDRNVRDLINFLFESAT